MSCCTPAICYHVTEAALTSQPQATAPKFHSFCRVSVNLHTSTSSPEFGDTEIKKNRPLYCSSRHLACDQVGTKIASHEGHLDCEIVTLHTWLQYHKPLTLTFDSREPCQLKSLAPLDLSVVTRRWGIVTIVCVIFPFRLPSQKSKVFCAAYERLQQVLSVAWNHIETFVFC